MTEPLASSIIDLSGVKQAVPEAVDPSLSWSPEDRAWLGNIPPLMQQVAKRHGKRLYLLAACSRNFNEGTAIIMKKNQGNAEVTRAIRVIASAFEALAGVVEEGVEGMDQKKLNAAAEDVGRAIALITSTTSKLPS